jgi:hypothetical protein
VAEVIGINTLKLIKKNVTGIGFALSASDVVEVLHRFYPNVVRAKQRTAPAAGPPAIAEISDAAQASNTSGCLPSPAAPDGTGTVTISSEPDGAEMFADEKFVGNAPASQKLSAGSHAILLRFPRHGNWRRTLEVLKSRRVSLRATLEPNP